MLVGLCRRIHPASGHRCVLGLVIYESDVVLLAVINLFVFLVNLCYNSNNLNSISNFLAC